MNSATGIGSHMLTTWRRPEAGRINHVEWDAVWKLPSQFWENVGATTGHPAGHGPPLAGGDPLPAGTASPTLLAARTFMAGASTLRQVHLALVDPAAAQPLGQRRLRHTGPAASPDRQPPHGAAADREDALLCSFGHIFAERLCRPVLLHKWAEVLSADAFQCLEGGGPGERGRNHRHRSPLPRPRC